MEEKEKKKQVAKISVFITSIFVIFLSISYAFINQTLVGTKKQIITAGNLQLNLTEGDSITLENALPMYDEVGMTQKPFTFSIENTTATPTNYVLKLENVTPEGRDKLDTSIVKYGLEKNGEQGVGALDDFTNGILDQGKIEGNEIIDYTLRLWIDSNVEDETSIKNKTLSYKIQVEASQEIEISYKGMIKTRLERKYVGGGTYISGPSMEECYQYSNQITQIMMEDKINIPDTIPDDMKWDMSEKQDNSMMAYLERNESIEGEEPTYKLHFQANGKIYANPNSAYLFSEFTNLEKIEGLENFDTSNVTDMSGMFSYYSSNQPLDLSSFNTSNVTNMSDMFSDYSSNQPLELSNFNTSNVTNMSGMFSYYSSSQPLDLSSFDTSKVTDMFRMFYGYSGGALTIGGFDTSNITDMTAMFSNYSSSQSLDLSNFNTSNVTNMPAMFSNYSSSQSLDLSNFNTSNVTDMSSMFSNWESETSLDISNFDFSKATEVDDIFYRKLEYYASTILVKDEATKAWVLEQNPNLTGVTIKGV